MDLNAIDVELEDELIELEFETFTFQMGIYPGELGPQFPPNHKEVDAQITERLNDGWRIHEQIVCAPFVKIILHREKETNES